MKNYFSHSSVSFLLLHCLYLSNFILYFHYNVIYEVQARNRTTELQCPTYMFNSLTDSSSTFISRPQSPLTPSQYSCLIKISDFNTVTFVFSLNHLISVLLKLFPLIICNGQLIK